MQSNRALKKHFRTLNRRFFDGELPDNVCVRWMDDGDLDEDIKCEDRFNGFCHKTKEHPHCGVIVLNQELKKDKGHLLSVLAHECIHVLLQYRDDHGPAFERERLKLSDKGFFRKSAVLEGLTLF